MKSKCKDYDSDQSGRSDATQNSNFKFKCCVAYENPTDIYGISFNHTIDTEWPIFATCGDKQIGIFECNDKKGIEVLQIYIDPDKNESFFSICWLFDEENRQHFVASGGERGIIRLIEISKANSIGSLSGHGHSINDLRPHPTRHMLLAAACKDYSIYLWNAKNREILAIFGGLEGHRDEVLSVDFDLCGTKIVSSGMDHAIKVWHFDENKSKIDKSGEKSLKSKKECRKTSRVYFPTASTRDLHTNYVDCVRCFGEFLVSKSCENEIRIWKFGNRVDLEYLDVNCLSIDSDVTLLANLQLPHTSVWFIKFAMDKNKKFLAAGNMKGYIYVWKLDSFESMKTGPVILKHPKCKNTIRQLDFSRDARILIGISDLGGIWRWDIGDFHG